jgi:hypothetical protein
MSEPPNVHCIDEARLLVWRPRGVLDEQKVDHIIAYLTDTENKMNQQFDRFTDLSLIDAVDLSFNYIFQVALYRRVARLGREPIKSAFFVTSPSVSRYVKLHAVLTDRSPLKVELFEDREAAAQWLGVDAAMLAPLE